MNFNDNTCANSSLRQSSKNSRGLVSETFDAFNERIFLHLNLHIVSLIVAVDGVTYSYLIVAALDFLCHVT